MKKGGWIKGIFFFWLAAGLLFAGIVVNHYWQAKAASKESINLQTYERHQGAVGTHQSAKMEKNTILNEKENAVDSHQDDVIKNVANVQNLSSEEGSIPPAADQTKGQIPSNQTTPPNSQPVQTANSQPENLQPVVSGKRIIYLTFDDGPEIFSKDIIALLEKYDYKATFFMLDGNIRRYPQSARLMVQSGEGVGLHGVTHDKNKFYASVNSVLGELTQDRNTLRDITGVNSFLMRTPYGSHPYMTDQYKKAVYDNGYLMWDWNIDSKDWYYRDSRFVTSVIDQLNNMANSRGPIVILLHEKRETLASLPQLLDYLSKHNFQSIAINSGMTPLHFR